MRRNDFTPDEARIGRLIQSLGQRSPAPDAEFLKRLRETTTAVFLETHGQSSSSDQPPSVPTSPALPLLIQSASRAEFTPTEIPSISVPQVTPSELSSPLASAATKPATDTRPVSDSEPKPGTVTILNHTSCSKRARSRLRSLRVGMFAMAALLLTVGFLPDSIVPSRDLRLKDAFDNLARASTAEIEVRNGDSSSVMLIAHDSNGSRWKVLYPSDNAEVHDGVNTYFFNAKSNRLHLVAVDDFAESGRADEKLFQSLKVDEQSMVRGLERQRPQAVVSDQGQNQLVYNYSQPNFDDQGTVNVEARVNAKTNELIAMNTVFTDANGRIQFQADANVRWLNRSLDQQSFDVTPDGVYSDVATVEEVQGNPIVDPPLEFAADYVMFHHGGASGANPELSAGSLGFGTQDANGAGPDDDSGGGLGGLGGGLGAHQAMNLPGGTQGIRFANPPSGPNTSSGGGGPREPQVSRQKMDDEVATGVNGQAERSFSKPSAMQRAVVPSEAKLPDAAEQNKKMKESSPNPDRDAGLNFKRQSVMENKTGIEAASPLAELPLDNVSRKAAPSEKKPNAPLSRALKGSGQATDSASEKETISDEKQKLVMKKSETGRHPLLERDPDSSPSDREEAREKRQSGQSKNGPPPPPARMVLTPKAMAQAVDKVSTNALSAPVQVANQPEARKSDSKSLNKQMPDALVPFKPSAGQSGVALGKKMATAKPDPSEIPEADQPGNKPNQVVDNAPKTASGGEAKSSAHKGQTSKQVAVEQLIPLPVKTEPGRPANEDTVKLKGQSQANGSAPPMRMSKDAATQSIDMSVDVPNVKSVDRSGAADAAPQKMPAGSGLESKFGANRMGGIARNRRYSYQANPGLVHPPGPLAEQFQKPGEAGALPGPGSGFTVPESDLKQAKSRSFVTDRRALNIGQNNFGQNSIGQFDGTSSRGNTIQNPSALRGGIGLHLENNDGQGINNSLMGNNASSPNGNIVNGAAFYRRRLAEPNSELLAGEVLSTLNDERSLVRARLANDAELVLGPKSEVILIKPTSVQLRIGELELNVPEGDQIELLGPMSGANYDSKAADSKWSDHVQPDAYSAQTRMYAGRGARGRLSAPPQIVTGRKIYRIENDQLRVVEHVPQWLTDYHRGQSNVQSKIANPVANPVIAVEPEKAQSTKAGDGTAPAP